MRHILARNVNEALSIALHQLPMWGSERPSRNGPVLAFPTPVLIEYTRPEERVLFSPLRNANPVFHLLESLWMLAGRRDVKFPNTIVKRMATFSDDGQVFHGAYGHRWREWFGYNQLVYVIEALKKDPTSRRVVLSMWDGSEAKAVFHAAPIYSASDLQIGMSASSKDVPCNTHIYFDMRDGLLNMTVCCRSNDIIWGCFGANAVHMSVLQEYVARSIGVAVGRYFQFSNDLHLYTEVVSPAMLNEYSADAHEHNYYAHGNQYIDVTPLWGEGETAEDFNEDLESFFERFDLGGMENTRFSYETDFFNFTIVPMVGAWLARKNEEVSLRHVENIQGKDWRRSVEIWVRSLHGRNSKKGSK